VIKTESQIAEFFRFLTEANGVVSFLDLDELYAPILFDSYMVAFIQELDFHLCLRRRRV